MDYVKKIGSKIRRQREKLGLTQQALATRMETSQSAITSWENGRREPTFQTLIELSKVLLVPISYFFDDFAEPVLDSSDAKRLQAIHDNPKLRMLIDELTDVSDLNLELPIKVILKLRDLSEDDMKLLDKLIDRFLNN